MTAWIDLVGWTLLHFVWQGTLVGLGAAVLLWLLRDASARARYLVACAALAVATAAPLVTAASSVGLLSIAPLVTVTASSPASVSSPVAAVRIAGSQLAEPVIRMTRGAATAAGQSGGIFPLIVAVWAAGVLFLTLRLALGMLRIRRLHVASLVAPPSRWHANAERVAARLRITRSIYVIDSTSVDTPTVIGWLRPVVLLPVAAFASLSPDQVQAILAHELAHIRRHDFAVNLLQTLAETLLFYHPAIWWISNRIRIEREHCCDDIAVGVCGDAVSYAEALAELASAAPASSMLAVAATGGSLLDRVRRLLRTDTAVAGPRRKTPIVLGATILLIVIVGMRIMLVAQAVQREHGPDRRIGPADVNAILGYDLFPPRISYATDDPVGARAWDVTVTFPGGEMPLIGFTARSAIRYAYDLNGLPVMDGPSWLDTESLALHATTPATSPDTEDVRLALRTALEQQYGIAITNSTRTVPLYSLVPVDPGGELGPDIRPSTVTCLEGHRQRPEVSGPILVERGQLTTLCGVDNNFTGIRAIRVSLAEFASALHGFPLDASGVGREVVNETGRTEPFDFTLRLGALPLAAVATIHPNIALGLRPIGIRTFQEAIEQQLGLRLEPTEGPRDVVVITSARKPA
jgi:uncharacterized protein (TIGR03435 family)